MLNLKNIVKGIFTTVLGTGIIVASIGTVGQGKASWAEASIPMAVGILLIFAPDTLFKNLANFLKKGNDTPPDPQP